MRPNRFKISCIPLFVVVSVVSIVACTGFFLRKRSLEAEPTLQFVSIIYRHGDRAPLTSLPPNLYEGKSYWPEGLGTLLQVGKLNMFKLGQFLRHRYDGFISAMYTPAEILVTSSNVDRCISSAQLVLAGLYPPVGIQIWNPDLLWQPVPVHAIPPACDKMFVMAHERCPLWSREETQRSKQVRKLADENRDLLSNISSKIGYEMKVIEDVWCLFDNLRAMEIQGYPLPNWSQYVDRYRVSSIHIRSFADFYSATAIKLQSGVLIHEILTNMKHKTNSSRKFDRRMNLYSAHDKTLFSFWRGVNISREINSPPPSGSALAIELHEINDTYRVKILYKKDADDEELSVLKIIGCENVEGSQEDNMCDLDTFSSVLKSAIISEDDFDDACRIPE